MSVKTIKLTGFLSRQWQDEQGGKKFRKQIRRRAVGEAAGESVRILFDNGKTADYLPSSAELESTAAGGRRRRLTNAEWNALGERIDAAHQARDPIAAVRALAAQIAKEDGLEPVGLGTVRATAEGARYDAVMTALDVLEQERKAAHA